ncbi:isoaspartyl peptidase/L-asparaginase, partial [Klebsiella pneumoniae]
MAYAGQSLEEASRAVVFETLPKVGGRGGVIAIDRHDNLALPFNTEGMYRAWGCGELAPVTAIYAAPA